MEKMQEILSNEGGTPVIKTYAVEIGDALWNAIYDYLWMNRRGDELMIFGIYEDGGQKFAILRDRKDLTYYRLNLRKMVLPLRVKLVRQHQILSLPARLSSLLKQLRLLRLNMLRVRKSPFKKKRSPQSRKNPKLKKLLRKNPLLRNLFKKSQLTSLRLKKRKKKKSLWKKSLKAKKSQLVITQMKLLNILNF